MRDIIIIHFVFILVSVIIIASMKKTIKVKLGLLGLLFVAIIIDICIILIFEHFHSNSPFLLNKL